MPAKKRTKETSNGKEENSSKKAKVQQSLVQEERVRQVQEGKSDGKGPVIYWMSREQRSQDNWGLIYAADQANRLNVGCAVVFNLLSEFLVAGQRQFAFMVKGLQEIPPKIAKNNIEFFFTQGDPIKNVSNVVKENKASLLVMDVGVLRISKGWRENIVKNVDCEVHEVDSHNIVPVWHASDKRETGARTIRSKIHKLLPEFLIPFPETPKVKSWDGKKPDKVDWKKVIAEVMKRGTDVPEVKWLKPGEDAGLDQLLNEKHGFFSPGRLKGYAERRNIPGDPKGLSNISPWLHFGQISAQRVALEGQKWRKQFPTSLDSFLEEMIVRRELSDNFCFYEPNYDNLKACAEWAKQTLKVHGKDKREYIYTRDQLEKAQTHDDLWNTAQLEMTKLGKMHGYVRMYWAKKIMEWSKSPEEALENAIYLNDKYEIDGRDSNGYVGCIWSIGGIHDQGWGERPIFGKIRYMNYDGCKRKFSIQDYKDKVDKMIKAEGK